MRIATSILAILLMAGTALPAVAGPPPQPKPSGESVQEVRCPVMGSVVKDTATALHSEYKGQTYFFCCPGCKPMFDADPEKYLGKTRP